MSDDDDSSFITDNENGAMDFAHQLFLKWFYYYVPESNLDTALRWEHTIAWIALLLLAFAICGCLAFWERVSRLRRLLIVLMLWLFVLATLIFLF